MPNSNPLIDQYTVTIVSSTVPKKVAGFAGPFQVINNNTSATVWLADNQAVHDGSGIPLNPGSSLTWTGSQGTQELYAILGTDTGSVGQSVNLVIGNSVQGWQQNPVAFAIAALNTGSILVDSPIAVVPSTSIVSGGVVVLPTVNGLYDVTTLQSIYVNYVKDTAAAHSVVLLIQWFTGPNALPSESGGNDVFQWVAGDNNALAGKCLPVRGSYVRITVTTVGGGATDTLTIMGSHRIWNPLSQNTVNRVIANGSNGALAAGATLTLTPTQRYDGPATINVAAAQAAGGDGLEIAVGDMVSGFFAHYAMKQATTLTGPFLRTSYSASFVAPRNSWNVTISNRSAAACNVNGEVVIAPDGT